MTYAVGVLSFRNLLILRLEGANLFFLSINPFYFCLQGLLLSTVRAGHSDSVKKHGK